MMRFAVAIYLTVAAAIGSVSAAPATRPTTDAAAIDYASRAREVTRHIQKTFYLPKDGLYAHSVNDRHADFMWGNGILFSALAGAARNDPQTYRPLMTRFFTALDRYWDGVAKVPGYEPSPTRGHGNDKYYDDNEWMVLTFVEAYEMTGDERYLRRAEATLTFALSGWDDMQGGGIWWHEGHKGDSKNTCSNAPAAVACLRVAKCQPAAKAKASVEMARRIVDWTAKTFQTKDGLFADSLNIKTHEKNDARLTYNTALMIRAWLGLYRATGDESFLAEAKRAAAAADWFLDAKTHAYRDSVKWSHLLVEADLEMYRATGDEHLLQRVTDNANYEYQMWHDHPPDELIDNASIARTLWLMADMQSEAGRAFWKKSDGDHFHDASSDQSPGRGARHE